MKRLRRYLRRLFGLLLVLLALLVVAGKGWVEYTGPYVETLPEYPFCLESTRALERGELPDAIELAEAGGCATELAAAERRWNSLGAVFGRCLDGLWLGTGEDVYGLGCAVASDLVVFGDVRDLTRQGVAWFRGEDTDEVLVALSAAGIALTLTPQLGAGASLMKAARRAGALTERFAKSVVKLVRERAWRQVGDLFADAGRISAKLGPANATRAVKYADDAAELATLSKFVDEVPHPLLGLRWGGKSVTRVADPDLYTAALKRGPAGVQLVAARGARALLARQPLIIFAAKGLKTVWQGVADPVGAIVRFVGDVMTWRWVSVVAGALGAVGLVYLASSRAPRRRRARV